MQYQSVESMDMGMAKWEVPYAAVKSPKIADQYEFLLVVGLLQDLMPKKSLQKVRLSCCRSEVHSQDSE